MSQVGKKPSLPNKEEKETGIGKKGQPDLENLGLKPGKAKENSGDTIKKKAGKGAAATAATGIVGKKIKPSVK